LTKIEYDKNLYDACKNVVDKCERAFEKLGMNGPDVRMGTVWYDSYLKCKAAIEFADKEAAMLFGVGIIGYHGKKYHISKNGNFNPICGSKTVNPSMLCNDEWDLTLKQALEYDKKHQGLCERCKKIIHFAATGHRI